MPRFTRRAIPWMLVLEAALVARDLWSRLPADDRSELVRILRKSGGRPANLTDRERSELLRIVKQLDVLDAGRRLLAARAGLGGFVRR
jgi:hypothetical protein